MYIEPQTTETFRRRAEKAPLKEIIILRTHFAMNLLTSCFFWGRGNKHLRNWYKKIQIEFSKQWWKPH